MKDCVIHLFSDAGLRRDYGHYWFLPEGANGLLALIYYDSEENAIAFTLLDLNTSTLLHNTRISVYGTHVEMLYLACNEKQDLWAIAALGYDSQAVDYRLKLYILSQDRQSQLTVSEPLLIEKENDQDLSGAGVIHALVITNSIGQVVYERDWVDDIQPVYFVVKQVDLATLIAQEYIVGDSDRILLCRQASSVITLSARFSFDRTQIFRRGLPADPVWQMSVSSSKNFIESSDWVYSHGPRLPLARPRRESFDRWDARVLITAKIITDASLTEGATQRYIIGMTMMETREETQNPYDEIRPKLSVQQRDGLFCLEASGRVIQQCTSSFGLYIDLCCCEQIVVGVDLQGSQWRLWNWRPLQETVLQNVLSLSEKVKRASVVANQAYNGQGHEKIWLIEEYADAVCVSKRNAQTLEEVETSVSLQGAHLLLPQFGPSTLDWHVYREVISYQNALVLAVTDTDGRLVIHEIA